MEYRSLGSTGLRVSVIGFGASPLGNEFGRVDEVESVRAVHAAIDLGINFFDVSPYYGRTLAESRLGAAIEGKRRSIFVATKCGRYDTNGFDFSGSRVGESLDESLQRLKTDYVDLLQAHDIEFADRRQIEEETIPALQEAKKSGKARFIGLTSYQLGMLGRLAESAPLDTVLSYCRFNVFVDDMDALLTPIVKRKGIGLINASPLHMGLLSDNPIPLWHPAPQGVKDAAARVRELCGNRGLDPVQIGLRRCLDHPYVATTLVGMASIRQVELNVGALALPSDDAISSSIAEITEPVKNMVWPSGRPENADYGEV